MKKFRILKGVLLLLSVAGLSGCGGSKAPETTVVPPPAPERTSQTTEPAERAGTPSAFELPPDTTDPAPQAAPKSGGGFEMPPDVPVESGASLTPTVQYASWDEIQAQAKTSGRITVLDLWSLSCEPCLKEFPSLVRLHQTFGTSVQCMAVNLDFDGRKTRPPQHYEEAVAAFLAGVGAKEFPNYICETPSDDVYAAADIDSIPAVLVFDAKGQLAKVFADAGETLGFSYEKDIFPLVEKLAG